MCVTEKKAIASRCPLYKELKELDDVGPNSSCHDVNPQVPVPSTKHQAPGDLGFPSVLVRK